MITPFNRALGTVIREYHQLAGMSQKALGKELGGGDAPADSEIREGRGPGFGGNLGRDGAGNECGMGGFDRWSEVENGDGKIMNDDPKIYGVIAEFKEEQPISMESPLLNYEKAKERMRAMAARPNVIRVAIFKAVHVDGNETLIPKEEEA